MADKKSRIYDRYTSSEDNMPQIHTFYDQQHKAWIKALPSGQARKDYFVKCGIKRPFKDVGHDVVDDTSNPSVKVNEAELDGDDNHWTIPQATTSKRFKSNEAELDEDDNQNVTIPQATTSERFKCKSNEIQLAIQDPGRVDLANNASDKDFDDEINKLLNLDENHLLQYLSELPNEIPLLTSEDVEKEFNQSPATLMQSSAENIHDLGNPTSLKILKNVNNDNQQCLPVFEKLIGDSEGQKDLRGEKGQDSELLEKKNISEFSSSRTPCLWYFILKCLSSCKNTEVVKWIDKFKGVFKITNEDKFSKLWSEEKCRVDVMPFTSIKRSIRNYRDSDIMKTIGKPKDNTWQFGDGTEWKKLAFSVKAINSYT